MIDLEVGKNPPAHVTGKATANSKCAQHQKKLPWANVPFLL